jgi:hypothetical protein
MCTYSQLKKYKSVLEDIRKIDKLFKMKLIKMSNHKISSELAFLN